MQRKQRRRGRLMYHMVPRWREKKRNAHNTYRNLSNCSWWNGAVYGVVMIITSLHEFLYYLQMYVVGEARKGTGTGRASSAELKY